MRLRAFEFFIALVRFSLSCLLKLLRFFSADERLYVCSMFYLDGLVVPLFEPPLDSSKFEAFVENFRLLPVA